MEIKRVDLKIPQKLVDNIDEAVKKSCGVIKSRNHYFELSTMEKLERDHPTPSQAMRKFGEVAANVSK